MLKEQLKNLKKGTKVHCIMTNGIKTNGVIDNITDEAIICDANYIPLARIKSIRGLKRLDKKSELSASDKKKLEEAKAKKVKADVKKSKKSKK